MLGLLLLHAVALGTPLRNQHVLADVMDAPTSNHDSPDACSDPLWDWLDGSSFSYSFLD
jgi:hypothetical protein